MRQNRIEAELPRLRWPVITLAACGLWLPLLGLMILALGVHNGTDWFFDVPLLLKLHAEATPLRDHVFLFFSYVGYRYGVVPVGVMLVLTLCILRHRREALFTAAALIGSAMLNYGCKQFFQRPRPVLWESIAPEISYSFPSGHSALSMALATTAMFLAWHTRWRWPILPIASTFVVGVGLSRLYLGVHYPSDVLAGWCVALAWVTGMYLMLFRWRRPWQPEAVQAHG
ncbi:MAG: phosphatase PAP2 family protein [Xanthomonadaceae bacterium]|jgi:undecaprenyl-diphosphatase|nr:phosphatase PAP2 family protein [Xanthomonadaceae bacterium]